MRILLFNWQDIRNPLAGGAEVHLHEIFSRIVSAGNQVTLYCSSFSGAPGHETVNGISVIREGSRNFFNYLVPVRYASYFSREPFDIVVDDINKIPFYTPLFVRKPTVAILHHLFGTTIFKEVGGLPALYVYCAERLALRVYRKTPFAVVSESTRRELIQAGFADDRITIVPNGVKLPHRDPEPSQELLIGHVGRLKRYKSVDHLVKAFQLVHQKLPQVRLIIVGEGDHRPDLQRLVRELHLDSVVQFTGYMDEEAKERLIMRCAVVVNCSVKEGWGMTVLEANAHGVPVVASNVPGLRDSVVDNKTGLLYEYGNIPQLAERLVQVLTDAGLRRRLASGAKEWARSFSWDRSAEQMMEVLHRAIRSFGRIVP
jgi:glycosyltransferase involved in cell wall biosynthesis